MAGNLSVALRPGRSSGNNRSALTRVSLRPALLPLTLGTPASSAVRRLVSLPLRARDALHDHSPPAVDHDVLTGREVQVSGHMTPLAGGEVLDEHPASLPPGTHMAV
jgi:hypothetical protein